MATKKKPFTVEKYDEIKKVLKDNKINSYELENYIMMKDIKFLRHTQRISITDADLLDMINSDSNKTKFESLLGEIREKEVK